MANNEIMLLGAGIMLGAGLPIVFKQEYSNRMHWGLFWIGTVIAISGTFL